MSHDSERETLWNFLGSWFPDADLEGYSDAEVVQNFLDVGNTPELTKVREQLMQLLNDIDLPIDRVSKEANRYFKSETECRAWLNMVYSKLIQK